MAYHITLIANKSSQPVAMTNPQAFRDSALINPGNYQPVHPVLINKGSPNSYTEALLFSNFIFTQEYDYCFWDTGSSQIAAVTQQNPTSILLVHTGSAGNIQITVGANGELSFSSATSAAAA